MTISITCNSCRAPNAQGAKFCRQCGASLAATTAPPMVVRACPACGQPAVGAQKFCRGCGQPLAAMSQDVQDAAARGGLPPRQQIIKRPLKMHTRRRAYRHLNHRHLQPTACHRACRKYPHGRRQNRMLQNPAGGRFGHGRLPAVCSPPSALRVGWCTRES